MEDVVLTIIERQSDAQGIVVEVHDSAEGRLLDVRYAYQTDVAVVEIAQRPREARLSYPRFVSVMQEIQALVRRGGGSNHQFQDDCDTEFDYLLMPQEDPLGQESSVSVRIDEAEPLLALFRDKASGEIIIFIKSPWTPRPIKFEEFLLVLSRAAEELMRH